MKACNLLCNLLGLVVCVHCREPFVESWELRRYRRALLTTLKHDTEYYICHARRVQATLIKREASRSQPNQQTRVQDPISPKNKKK